MSHHNYPNREKVGHSRTGSDFHSGSAYSEQAHPYLNSTLLASLLNNDLSTYPTVQRSTLVPYEPLYDPPAQQQQTHTQYPAYQQLSEARYHSGHGQTYSSSYNEASLASSSADPWRSPPLDVPEDGRWRGQPYYPSHTDLQIPSASSDLRSPHSAYSVTSSFSQCQSPTIPAYPAGHSPSLGAVSTVSPANLHYQQSMAVSHASFERNSPSFRAAAQSLHASNPPAPSPVPHDIPAKTPEPTIKKRKRTDARQLEALNRMYARSAFPSRGERQQLAKQLDMSAESVRIWFKNKRHSSRRGGRNPANSGPSVGQVSMVLPPRIQHIPVNPRTHEFHGSTTVHLPLAMMKSGQSSSPPSGRSRADIDPRRHFRGY